MKFAIGGFIAISVVGTIDARDFAWTGRGGDGKWTNPTNWEGGDAYPAQTNDFVRFRSDARVILDTGRTTAIASLAVETGTVTVVGASESAIRTVAIPRAVGRDGLVVGSREGGVDQASLILAVPVDCGDYRMDKWYGGRLVLQDQLISAMDNPHGFGFIFGSGETVLQGTAKISIPTASLGVGNGEPDQKGMKQLVVIADAAQIDVDSFCINIRSVAHGGVVVRQTGVGSEVHVHGSLRVGMFAASKGEGSTYRIENGLLTAGDVLLGSPERDRFVLAGGTFLATQDMTLPTGTVFEGEPKIGAAECCRLTMLKWPDGARRLLIAGAGEVVLGRGFVRKGEIKVLSGKVVDKTSDLVDVGDRLAVFWDDYLVDTRLTTTHRQVHQPEYAGAVMVHDRPWEGDGCDFHNILVDKDELGTVYRMYYLGWQMDGMAVPTEKTPSFTGIRVCYAESRDGLNWVKPDLGLVEYNGSVQNNIVLDVCHFGYAWDNFMVFRDDNPKCPENERYKGVGACWGKADSECFGGGLCCFLSADGIHWRKGWRLTKTGDFDSLNVAFWDPVRGEYHCYFRGHHNQNPPDRHGNVLTRDIRHMVSRDFRNWTMQKPITFDPEAEDYALYTNVVQPYPRAPEIYVGFPSRYVERKKWTDTFDKLPGVENRRVRFGKSPRYGLAVTDCVFMMSRDGRDFHREEDAFIAPGPENPLNWVYGDCYPAWGILTLPGRRPGADPELSFYTFEGHWSGRGETILRYVLRQDGFVSRRAAYAGARLVTKPFVFKGDELALNFKTSARGGLFVALRESKGSQVIRSDEIIGDKIDRVIGFKDGEVADFRGKTVVLEFEMRDADIYAFQFRGKRND